ncbi:MAG: hypothetical protein H0U76_22445 [Ktedonobacteraceae bacterium]|nr:hypothetical protein [Ktedonobacteraceae bacterium]
MENLSTIGQARIDRQLNTFSLTLDWRKEIPHSQQIDIAVFLLELFREEPGLDEYHRISMVTELLYSFEIVERSPVICVDIYSTDD